METKICTVCELKKPVSDFYKRGNNKLKYRSECKECSLKQRKKYNIGHKKEASEYHKSYGIKNRKKLNKYRRDYNAKNPNKMNEYRKKYRENNDTDRMAEIKRKYGLSKEGYYYMLDIQDNKCKICGKEMEKICIDHNHITGKIRGLLCNNCNLGIGNLQENPFILIKTVEYLKQ